MLILLVKLSDVNSDTLDAAELLLYGESVV